MPRYSLNLRPIYGPEDVPWQQSLGQGISNAIGEYQRKKEIGRQEANQVGAIGGVPVPDAPSPSPMDRLRSIGSTIGDVLHGRFNQGSTVPNATGSERDGLAPGTPPALPAGAPIPTPTGGPLPMSVFDRGAGGALPQPAGRPGVNPALGVSPETRAGRMAPPPVMTSAMPAAPVPPRQPAATIGSAIHPYTYEGITGQKYSVDPLYGARVAAEGKTMAKDAEDEQAISALVAAGMDPKLARAKVLTNTVKYDEQYGMRGNASRLTFAERAKLQSDNNAVRLQIARMAAAGRQDTAEYRKALLQQRQIEDQLRADEREAAGYASEAAAVERTIPSGTNRIVEQSQPGGAERIEGAAKTAAELRGKARDIRGKNAQRFRTGTGGTTFTPEQTRARAIELKNQGYSKSAIYEMMKREGYNIAPPRE